MSRTIDVFVTVKQMRELEDRAVKEYGMALSALMENAGRAVAAEAMQMVKKGPVAVFCGYGNNGGDGMVAARYLIKSGYRVKIFLAGIPKTFSPETNANYIKLLDLKHQPEQISAIEEIDRAFENMPNPGLIIDAIFGIGLKGMLENFHLKLIEKINTIGVPVIAVDIPSGLNADTGEPLGIAITATKTITLGCMKIGFKNPKAKACIGELVVADIGLLKFKE